MQVLEANPQVADDTGRVAIQRGPLVYCMEELDQPEGVSITDLAVSPGAEARIAIPERIQEATCWEGWSCFATPAWPMTGPPRAMRCTRDTAVVSAQSRSVPLTFIPYYAWSNRQQTAMQVWTPVLKA